MATIAYSSQSSKAKPTKVAYCSIGGQAKRIKRVYGSVGGKAKIIYDTATVKYIKDNGYTNNTTVTYTEVIGKGCLIPQKDNLHWYKADGTEWNFSTDRIQADVTLYEAVYSGITAVTFDGSHYVQTGIKPKVSNWDCRGTCTPSDITSQRAVFGVYSSPVIELYINGSGYWNVGVGNNSSSVKWSAASNKVKATRNYQMSWRFNLATSSTKYLQIWQDNYPSSNGNWSSCTAINQGTTANNGIRIGYNGTSGLAFKGTIATISWKGEALRPHKRIKGGSTVEGFVADSDKKFCPLITV